MRRWIRVCIAAMLTVGVSLPAAAWEGEPPVRQEYLTLPGAVGPGPAGDTYGEISMVLPGGSLCVSASRQITSCPRSSGRCLCPAPPPPSTRNGW
jgi:hypothetical protein